jgi:hypothetical protein
LTVEAGALLGLPVCADGVRLGTVGAVWVDGSDGVLGIEVNGTWNSATHYLPFAASRVIDGTVSTSSLAVLASGPTSFFAEQGAKRVAATETVGFGNVERG